MFPLTCCGAANCYPCSYAARTIRIYEKKNNNNKLKKKKNRTAIFSADRPFRHCVIVKKKVAASVWVTFWPFAIRSVLSIFLGFKMYNQGF